MSPPLTTSPSLPLPLSSLSSSPPSLQSSNLLHCPSSSPPNTIPSSVSMLALKSVSSDSASTALKADSILFPNIIHNLNDIEKDNNDNDNLDRDNDGITTTTAVATNSENGSGNERSESLTRIIRFTMIEKIETDDDHFTLTLKDGESLSFYNNDMKAIVDWVFTIRSYLMKSLELSADSFEILAEIGRGRYSTVKLVEKKDDHKQYAMKVVDKSFLSTHGNINSALTERNILSRVSHPFIITLDYAFQSPTHFYFCMEYMKGGDLFRHMKNSPRLRFEEIRLYVAEIALAIHHLHNYGIVYRDLKPENLMLSEDGHVKLIDFNLSKEVNKDLTNSFCGTVEYLAPEIVLKRQYGKEIDWWSLGIMVFEMVFNRTPFRCQNQTRTLAKIANGNVIIPDCADFDLVSLINGLLTKDPIKRFRYIDIANHPFFDSINFDDVYKKKYKPLNKPKIIEPKAKTNMDNASFGDDYTNVLGDIIYVPGFSLDRSCHYNISVETDC